MEGDECAMAVLRAKWVLRKEHREVGGDLFTISGIFLLVPGSERCDSVSILFNDMVFD